MDQPCCGPGRGDEPRSPASDIDGKQGVVGEPATAPHERVVLDGGEWKIKHRHLDLDLPY